MLRDESVAFARANGEWTAYDEHCEGTCNTKRGAEPPCEYCVEIEDEEKGDHGKV